MNRYQRAWLGTRKAQTEDSKKQEQKKKKKQPSNPNNKKQLPQDNRVVADNQQKFSVAKGARNRARNEQGERETPKMNRGSETSARDRGRHHHYRDEFGRQPPPHYRDEFGRQPPPHWNNYDNPPQGYYRGPPRHRHHRDEGRWERDRGMHNAARRSPPRHRHSRDRRHRTRRSPSYSSRSLSRGSSASLSSSESERSGSYDSRSRSRSFSRSPSPQSPVEKDGKQSPRIDEQNTDGIEKNLAKSQQAEAKKEDSNGGQSPSSSKSSSKDNKKVVNRSPSRSRSVSEESRGRSRRRGRDRKRKGSRKNSRSSRSRSRSRSSSVSRSRSTGSYSSSSSHYSRQRRRERRSKRRRRKQKRGDKHSEDGFSKDQRTIFVSQLVMRTTERDLKKYFKRKVGCKVNDVILLRDRRNARNHKGCAYVEVGRIEDVATAVAVSGQPPDFQRFPILIKASEAEKNYANPLAGAANGANSMTKIDASMSPAIAVTPNTNGYANADQDRHAGYSNGTSSFLPPLRDENGRLIESQKVYVGGLDPSVRQDHLYALFSPFGNLKKVQLQYHPNTQISRGYAFLTFHDPKVSNLAIRTMAGKIVTGRPLKTGWANQNQQSAASIASGCIVVTSDQFPENAAELTQKALSVLAQMTGGTSAAAAQQLPLASNAGGSGTNSMALSAMAEQELDKAMGLVGGSTSSTATLAPAQSIPTVADARASMGAGATVAEARASLAADVAARQLAAATSAAAAATKSAFIGNTSNGPTCHLLVHNMYDKDEETDPGWEAEIKEEFLDECSKFGKIEHAKVMHLEPGGKIFVTFATLEGAKTCAENLAGRWFDKRQLRVDYMPEANPP